MAFNLMAASCRFPVFCSRLFTRSIGNLNSNRHLHILPNFKTMFVSFTTDPHTFTIHEKFTTNG